MNWIILFIAGACEICWAVGMKLSDGFRHAGWSVFTIIFLIISMVLLAISLKSLPIGTAYGIWTGIGAVGTAILGIVLFNESADAMRLVFITLIVAGIVGLKVIS